MFKKDLLGRITCMVSKYSSIKHKKNGPIIQEADLSY